ncbi:MAG: mandelate racemase/muconate lactonizing enzyme family protein [Halobacteriaceae archaeon]
MEITDVTTYPVRMPLEPLETGVEGLAPYVTNHNQVESFDRLLVRVETDAGIEGWGEVRVLLDYDVMQSAIEDGIAPLVVGRSPFELESFRRLLFVEYASVDVYFAGVEMACWDIVGKALEKPVYELLGGWTAPASEERRRDPGEGGVEPVELAYCLGILPPEESAARAEAVLDAGYTVLKTKAGRDWKQDVERIAAMDEATDGNLEFRLDPNQGWRPDEAVRVGAALADRGVYLQYMEQPIRVDAHDSLARLRERTTQPIGPNEDTYIKYNVRELARAGAMDVAVLDMTPLGGIAGLRQAAAICEDANVPAVHHCAGDLGVRTAAILHAVSGIPGFALPADTLYYAWTDDVIEEPFEVEDGALTPPEGPGFGVEVAESKLDEWAPDAA